MEDRTILELQDQERKLRKQIARVKKDFIKCIDDLPTTRDRILINGATMTYYPEVNYEVLSEDISDHYPLCYTLIRFREREGPISCFLIAKLKPSSSEKEAANGSIRLVPLEEVWKAMFNVGSSKSLGSHSMRCDLDMDGKIISRSTKAKKESACLSSGSQHTQVVSSN
ncbi:hypothetical protein Cgig2_009499 [Carnegiea gigantea]|uniref:Uncharacterized protein n=1 Tax=Carnegiea gigantea TaxID=171969 RepID=A0A9Q1JWR0_9CARY|nr:hypothetical protein Cgig2_009499 [Carnegiea gigantea]